MKTSLIGILLGILMAILIEYPISYADDKYADDVNFSNPTEEIKPIELNYSYYSILINLNGNTEIVNCENYYYEYIKIDNEVTYKDNFIVMEKIISSTNNVEKITKKYSVPVNSIIYIKDIKTTSKEKVLNNNNDSSGGCFINTIRK